MDPHERAMIDLVEAVVRRDLAHAYDEQLGEMLVDRAFERAAAKVAEQDRFAALFRRPADPGRG